MENLINELNMVRMVEHGARFDVYKLTWDTTFQIKVSISNAIQT
jgi:hypothetical protein